MSSEAYLIEDCHVLNSVTPDAAYGPFLEAKKFYWSHDYPWVSFLQFAPEQLELPTAAARKIKADFSSS
jgi:hypothetical protein